MLTAIAALSDALRIIKANVAAICGEQINKMNLLVTLLLS
jgi:hypothetical protein